MLTVEQIKTLINGLKQPLMNVLRQAQEAEDTAKEALDSSEQTQSELTNKMNSLNPVGEGSFSLNRQKGSIVGRNSFAAGRSVTASGPESHAEGVGTIASIDASHAEGNSSEATGYCSHAEGTNSRASGHSSHAEGQASHAEGNYSHAEGNNTRASGNDSHAEGSNTEATGLYSHAEGRLTIAEGVASHVEGQANIPSTYEYLHIVGNGDNDGKRRSNAHTLDWEGNAWFQGDVLVGSTSGTNRDEGSVRLAKITEVIPVPAKAEVGQTVRVSAVDKNGVPTAWEAASSGKWRYIGRITTEEDVTHASLSVDSYGKPFSLSRVLIQGRIAPNNHDATGYVKPVLSGKWWSAAAVYGVPAGEGIIGRGFRYELEIIDGRVFGRLPLESLNYSGVWGNLIYAVGSGRFVDMENAPIYLTEITSVGMQGWQEGTIGAGSYFDIWGIDV